MTGYLQMGESYLGVDATDSIKIIPCELQVWLPLSWTLDSKVSSQSAIPLLNAWAFPLSILLWLTHWTQTWIHIAFFNPTTFSVSNFLRHKCLVSEINTHYLPPIFSFLCTVWTPFSVNTNVFQPLRFSSIFLHRLSYSMRCSKTMGTLLLFLALAVKLLVRNECCICIIACFLSGAMLTVKCTY